MVARRLLVHLLWILCPRGFPRWVVKRRRLASSNLITDATGPGQRHSRSAVQQAQWFNAEALATLNKTDTNDAVCSTTCIRLQGHLKICRDDRQVAQLPESAQSACCHTGPKYRCTPRLNFGSSSLLRPFAIESSHKWGLLHLLR